MSSILAGCCSWDCSASPALALVSLSSLLGTSAAPGQQEPKLRCSIWSFHAKGQLGLVYEPDLSLGTLRAPGTTGHQVRRQVVTLTPCECMHTHWGQRMLFVFFSLYVHL